MNEKRALMSLRVPDSKWMDLDEFKKMFAVLARNREAVDELSFFLSSGIHSVLPLETVRRQAAILKDRIAEAKRNGYRAGINVLATLGHVDEYLENALKGDFTGIVGNDGAQAKGSFCPNDPKFRTHLAEVYKTLAELNPDFIWLDDDLRLANHNPSGYGCFCNNCLRIFNEANGSSFNRKSLFDAFDIGGIEDKLKLRKSWLVHNSRTISLLLSFLEDVIHKKNPEIKLGLMTVEHFYENFDNAEWAKALSGGALSSLKWRPGGGFYSDGSMGLIAVKANSIGRQIALLPKEIVDIQSEIENFPYQLLKKSKHAVAIETAVYMAAGCNGTALNILGFINEPSEIYEPMLKHIAAKRPFFDLLRNAMSGKENVGICPVWNKAAMASNHLQSGRWLDGWDRFSSIKEAPNELLELGFPPAYSIDNGEVFLLSDDIAFSLERKELELILSKGVYMDGKALAHLHSLGLGELTGFKLEGWVDNDCTEILTDESLNGNAVGSKRDCIQSFWNCPCAALSPINSNAIILGRKTLRTGGIPDFPCMGSYENPSGGRVVVAGYAPWTLIQGYAKTSQLKRLFRWLSHDTLSAYVSSYHKANLWVKRDASGGLAALLLNASQDPAENLCIAFLTTKRNASVTDMNGNRISIQGKTLDENYVEFVLPFISPWHVVLLEV